MIIRAEVLTSSQDDDLRRVKVRAEGIYDESPLIESVNGLFLRPGEIVYVDVSDGYEAPFIIGRCGNWIDADEILELFNKLVDAHNETRKKLNDLIKKHNSLVNSYKAHKHTGSTGYSGYTLQITTEGQSGDTEETIDDMDEIEMKEIFHEDS